MPARPKLTPADRARIICRLDAGETQTAIAADFPVGRQRITELNAVRLERLAQEEAVSAVEREAQAALGAARGRWQVTLDPKASSPLYFDPEQRHDYWFRRSLESEYAWIDLHTVERGGFTPDEKRALATRRRLYLRAPGVQSQHEAAQATASDPPLASTSHR